MNGLCDTCTCFHLLSHAVEKPKCCSGVSQVEQIDFETLNATSFLITL